MENSSVYIVILAWNHIDDTIDCIDSFFKTEHENKQIIIVDNGSTDNTEEILKSKYNNNIRIIRSEKNLGIAGGYNIGMKYAYENNADYLIIANNDIIVDNHLISNFLKNLNYLEKVGILFPKIYHYFGKKERIWTTGARWRKFPPSVKMLDMDAVDDGKNFNKITEKEFVPSCCLLLTRELIEKVGYFDTSYFFYNDDWDYCLRTINKGLKIYFIPGSVIWHKVSISTQKSKKPNVWWFNYGKSTKIFYKKHFSNFELVLFSAWYVFRETIKLNFSRIIPFLIGVSGKKFENYK